MRTSAAKVPLGGAAKVPPRVKVVVSMAPSAPADGTLRNTEGAYKGLSAATARPVGAAGFQHWSTAPEASANLLPYPCRRPCARLHPAR
jgi:hypothetical protein